MPKIIKNGKEYSGVPIEVVTAWAPTADPVQVKEPLMGNTDISTIGDGTVTGAIDALKNGLTKSAIVDQDGTVTTSSTGTANISSIIPNRTVPVFARATNESAFITIMYNINNTYWIRALNWDGAPLANKTLNLKVFGLKADAIKDW